MHTEPNDQLPDTGQQAEQLRRLQRRTTAQAKEHQQLLEDQGARGTAPAGTAPTRRKEPRVDRGHKAAGQTVNGVSVLSSRHRKEAAKTSLRDIRLVQAPHPEKRTLTATRMVGRRADDDQDRPVAQNPSSTGGTGLGVGFRGRCTAPGRWRKFCRLPLL